MSYKKGTPQNAMLKLALNGVYGDSNNKYSPFYDPQYTMTITINGQLMICMLAEKYMEIEGVQIIQVNTDGVTIKCPRNKIDDVEKVNKEWCKTTMLDLERADYKRMFVRDVNNYIGEFADGSLKRKGAYEYVIGWHQNHSALVVQKVAEKHLVEGTPVSDAIMNHDDIYDFMLRTKIPRSSRLMHGDEQVQNVSRYYISKNGKPLVKIMPPLPKKIEKGERHFRQHVKDKASQWGVTVMNTMGDVDNIDHDWYIEEVRKLVDPLYKGVLDDMLSD